MISIIDKCVKRIRSKVKNYFKYKKSKKVYYNKLIGFLQDGKLSIEEKEELLDIIKEVNLKPNDLLRMHKDACSWFFKHITSDMRINDDEKNNLEELMGFLKLNIQDYEFDQALFNKSYVLGGIEQGVLPVIDNTIDVILKSGETMHWGCSAVSKKYKKITERINFSGLSGSIKIAKGLRYRVGSVNVGSQSKEYLISDDAGMLWITNKRIGFKGMRKSFVLEYQKILSFDITPDGLVLIKEGKELPYIIALDDYDVPCSIISYLINVS